MLPKVTVSSLDALDLQFFDAVVPIDHYLRRVEAAVDFDRCRATLNERYSLIMGRTPIDPVRMFKILFLAFHYQLSDRSVMQRAQTDMAFRWFLGFGRFDSIPDHTNGTHFRQRIGNELFNRVFQEVVTQAREHGLVNDRLRLKDATHLLANAADITPMGLVAQVRDRLLYAAKFLFPEWAAEQQTTLSTLRVTTAELPENERLCARVEYLRSLMMQLQELVRTLPTLTENALDPNRDRLERALAIAAKLLEDRADLKAGDRLASGVDEDARTGKHGSFFVGYMLDIAIDPTHGIITAMNVLAGNTSKEAADAVELIRQEETAQGNDVGGISMDGAGYNGPVLRELMDPAGLNLDVTVPPPQAPERATFGPERFSLTLVESEDGTAKGELKCPQGETTRQRTKVESGFQYQYKSSQCSGCPLRGDCMQNSASKKGRTVIKNDHEAEYKKVHEKAKTPEYAQTRKIHPRIERKLGEMVRHHDLRNARYRGQPKVLTQSLLTGLVVNVKAIVNALTRKADAAATEGAVRAELANG